MLAQFPLEACDITCKLLGIYLYEHHIEDIAIFRGNHPSLLHRNHHWLKVGNATVDITADQFVNENQPTVLVLSHSPWHNRLCGTLHKKFDFAYYHLLMTQPYYQFTREMHALISATLLKHSIFQAVDNETHLN